MDDVTVDMVMRSSSRNRARLHQRTHKWPDEPRASLRLQSRHAFLIPKDLRTSGQKSSWYHLSNAARFAGSTTVDQAINKAAGGVAQVVGADRSDFGYPTESSQKVMC